jgi:hypothetical protein
MAVLAEGQSQAEQGAVGGGEAEKSSVKRKAGVDQGHSTGTESGSTLSGQEGRK